MVLAWSSRRGRERGGALRSDAGSSGCAVGAAAGDSISTASGSVSFSAGGVGVTRGTPFGVLAAGAGRSSWGTGRESASNSCS